MRVDASTVKAKHARGPGEDETLCWLEAKEENFQYRGLGVREVTTLPTTIRGAEEECQAVPTILQPIPSHIKDWGGCILFGLPKLAQIHPMFHVSLLKRKVGHMVQLSPTLPPVDALGILKSEPETILDRRLRKKGCFPVVEVLVRWQGQSDEDATWEGFY